MRIEIKDKSGKVIDSGEINRSGYYYLAEQAGLAVPKFDVTLSRGNHLHVAFHGYDQITVETGHSPKRYGSPGNNDDTDYVVVKGNYKLRGYVSVFRYAGWGTFGSFLDTLTWVQRHKERERHSVSESGTWSRTGAGPFSFAAADATPAMSANADAFCVRVASAVLALFPDTPALAEQISCTLRVAETQDKIGELQEEIDKKKNEISQARVRIAQMTQERRDNA